MSDKPSTKEMSIVSPETVGLMTSKLIETLVQVRMMLIDCTDEEIVEIFDGICSSNNIKLLDIRAGEDNRNLN